MNEEMIQNKRLKRRPVDLTFFSPTDLRAFIILFYFCFPSRPLKIFGLFSVFCCCSVTQSCPTLCDPMDYSTPGFPVHHHLPELAQTHVH